MAVPKQERHHAVDDEARFEATGHPRIDHTPAHDYLLPHVKLTHPRLDRPNAESDGLSIRCCF